MNIWSKGLLFMVLFAGTAVQGADAERKENAAKTEQTLDEQLLEAVQEGSIDRVQTLLSKNANPNAIVTSNSCPTSLISALVFMHNNPNGDTYVKIIKLLLETKANPNIEATNILGLRETPLSAACWIYSADKKGANKKILQCAELLLSHNANVNESCDMVSSIPTKAPLLCHATYLNLPDLVSLYLTFGAETECADRESGTFRDYADDKPEILQIYKEHLNKMSRLISDASKLLPPLTQLCMSYLCLSEHDYRRQRAQVIGATIPQLTHVQNSKEEESDLTQQISEYI